ncbi:MAG: AraC family transcriptional regulator [Lentisphaeria bacterium]|nr:AraC family transcriptional regulator [Lentisphaeria bacterium]
MRKIVGRPDLSTLPDLPLPVHIRSSGYNEAEPGWEEYETDKPFVQVFWCVQGQGLFLLPDGEVTLRPGETFFHLPGEIHHHRSCDPAAAWRYYWFTFDGPAAADFMLSYGYSRRSMHSGECPVELFLELEILVRKATLYSQRHALAAAAEILARMGGTDEPAPAEDLVRRCLGLIRLHMRDPELTVADLARKLGVHRTTLNRKFREAMGFGPGEHLDALRLQHALRLLRDTSVSLKEVAEHSGLANQSYFCRLVREATGLTPKRYRERELAAQSGALRS